MAVSMSIKQFNASCQDYRKYPLNLSHHVSNNGSLVAHRILLKESAPDLFYKKSKVKILELKKAENPMHSGNYNYTLRTHKLHAYHL
jgi:hypothetical protein